MIAFEWWAYVHLVELSLPKPAKLFWIKKLHQRTQKLKFKKCETTVPTYLPIYLPTYLLTDLSTYLPIYFRPIYLPTYLLTYLPAYRPTFLPIYFPVYLAFGALWHVVRASHKLPYLPYTNLPSCVPSNLAVRVLCHVLEARR